MRQEAVEIDRESKAIKVRNLETGEVYRESYDKLILSPGAHAVIPNLPGIDSERIFTLRTVEDTFKVHGFVRNRAPRIRGGSRRRLHWPGDGREPARPGLDVTVVQRGGHVMPTLDADMAAIAHNHLRSHGVKLLLNSDVTGFEERADGAVQTNLAQSGPLAADMVVLAVGVAPESALAREAGLDLATRESIKVDEHMRTSDSDIYAVGDAVQVKNYVTGQDALIALAGPANKQGRIAADNICGIASTFTGSQGLPSSSSSTSPSPPPGSPKSQRKRRGLMRTTSFSPPQATPPTTPAPAA